MNKTDKKIEKSIIEALTQACDIAQEQYSGFTWLTHLVNYHNFPKSLAVICIFETNKQLANTDTDSLRKLIQEKLLTINITLNDIRQQIVFDTEESCANQNNGDWNARLTRH